jgi:hypothetical protein
VDEGEVDGTEVPLEPKKTGRAAGAVMENLLQNIASGLWIVIGIQVLVWLKHWNKKFSDLYDELKWEVE